MSYKMLITYLAACSLGIITTGCSSLSLGDKDQKMVEIPASKADEIPAWFIEKEADNSQHVTVTATDISKDMQFAIDKATLNAKVQLAQKLGTSVQSLVTESSLENGYGVKDVEREIDRVSKSRTDQKIGFYRRENLKVVREGSHYRAYVMLKLSLEEGRRLTYNSSNKTKQTREERLKELDTPEIKPVQ